MPKQKRKLTAAEKAEKKRRRLLYKFVFINGKQVWVKREPQIEGMNADEFIRRNADPLWLHQNELWGYIVPETDSGDLRGEDNDASEKKIGFGLSPRRKGFGKKAKIW
jgi:hypothetical protein